PGGWSRHGNRRGECPDTADQHFFVCVGCAYQSCPVWRDRAYGGLYARQIFGSLPSGSVTRQRSQYGHHRKTREDIYCQANCRGAGTPYRVPCTSWRWAGKGSALWFDTFWFTHRLAAAHGGRDCRTGRGRGQGRRDYSRLPEGAARRMKKGKYLLPNLFTSANLVGGFLSMIAAHNGQYTHPALVILLAAGFDCLDGKVARLTGSASALESSTIPSRTSCPLVWPQDGFCIRGRCVP